MPIQTALTRWLGLARRQPAAELVARLAEETEAVIQRLSSA